MGPKASARRPGLSGHLYFARHKRDNLSMRIAALVMSLALALPAAGQEAVSAIQETHVNRASPGDSAIWVNRGAPLYSFVYGADARQGVLVFDILGHVLQRLHSGPIAAIDTRPDFLFGNAAAPLIAAANASDGALLLYRAMANGKLQPAEPATLPAADPALGAPTSLALFEGRDGTTSLFEGFEAGQVRQWRIEAKDGEIGIEAGRTIVLEAPVTAMAADDALGTLFVASGEMLWRFPAGGRDMESAIVDRPGSPCMPASGFGSLAIYPTGPEKGWLIAGERGGPHISVYRRETGARSAYACIGTFEVGVGLFDAVEDVTSLEVNAVAFGKLYPRGLLVVGDGADNRGTRNLKFVSWERVIEALGLDALS